MAMRDDAATSDELVREMEELRLRLEEAESTILAIRSGHVDAFVVTCDDRDEVFTLETADRPYRLFVQSMQQGAVTLDGDGTILFCNDYLADLLKTPRERMAGTALVEFVREEDLAVYHSLLPAGQGELSLRRADGTSVPVGLDIHPLIEDPRTVTLCVLVTDLTEQKHYEQLKTAQTALRQSEQRFRQLADAMPQMVWAARPDGYIDYYNERWYEYTGFPRDEYGQQSWQAILHPDDVERCIKVYFGCIQAETPYQIEYRFKDGRSGGYRWFLGRAIPVRDESDRIVRWFGTCTDIDDTKKLQEELSHTAAKLSEADRRKDEFLATLAHELRNPLAPIRTGLELMKMVDDPATIEEIRSTMERQTQQMVMLIDDLMDVSRITQGKLQLRKCRVKLADIVRSAVEASSPFILEAGHELTVAIPESPIFLEADPHRLAQVLSNLLNNAAKYTKEGGRIWFIAERQENEVVVTVKDTGIGIPAEMLERIFELFAQIDRPMERGYTGLGIGLTLVKSLVEMHGGRIDVRSEGPDQGSQFCVRLPLLREWVVPETRLNRPEQNGARSSKRRVLVVDDNKAAADMLSMVVKMLGNEVRTAGDGWQAVTVAAEFLPDMVVMDLGMPRMNGYEAARHIRQQTWGEKMMLVALTGWGKEDDRQRTHEAGFDHHLVKPAEPAALQELFSKLEQRLV